MRRTQWMLGFVHVTTVPVAGALTRNRSRQECFSAMCLSLADNGFGNVAEVAFYEAGRARPATFVFTGIVDN